jgi:malate/lactate dehydrogenase
MKKVGIISGSGFIESDIVSLFLNNAFDVKVSTIDITKKENYQHLMELDHADNLYVCELDDKKASEMTAFATDCDYVIFIDQPSFKF